MLNDYFKLELNSENLEKYAAQIGADCPFFIRNKPAFATGIGDKLQEINLDLADFEIIIVKPSISVSTPEAYRNVTPSKPNFSLKEIGKVPVEDWKDLIVNDFEQTI